MVNQKESIYKKNKQVESLRGLTMILVLVFHLFCRYQQIYENRYPTFLLINRWGVVSYVMFFLMSGYFLTFEKKGGIALFYKRLSKLWPTYVVTITIVFIITRFWNLPERTVSFVEYLWNLLFINGFVKIAYIDGAHWYLTVLVACICIYCLVLLINKEKKRIAIMLAWLLVTTMINMLQTRIGSGVLSVLLNLLGGQYMPMILMGSAMAYISKSETRHLGILLASACIGSTSIMLGPLFALVLIVDVIVFTLTLCLQFPTWINSLLGWFARVSYPVYLIHSTVGYLLIYYLSRVRNGYTVWISFGVTILMLGAGCALHVLVEKPVARFTSRLIRTQR